MTRYMPIVVLIGFVSTIACDAAPITYQITPRAGDAPGWGILGGEIVTDGTLGEIYPENFTSWRMEISSPAGVSVLTNDNSDVILIRTVYGTIDGSSDGSSPAASLVATTESLAMIPRLLVIVQLYFTTHNILIEVFPDQLVMYSPGGVPGGWVSGPVGTGGGTLIDNRVDPENPNPFYVAWPPNFNRAGFATEAGPLAIGTAVRVPEPSSFCAGGIAISIYFLAITSSHRRKS